MPALLHRCEKCGYSRDGYFDHCPRGCGWNTAKAQIVNGQGIVAAAAPTAVPLSSFENVHFQRLPTGIVQLDAALGGGFVPGTTTIFSGMPGSGKTTLAIQAAFALSFIAGYNAARPALYLSNEQSAPEILDLAKRLALGVPYLWFANPADLETVRLYATKRGRPSCVVIDSLQEFCDSANPGRRNFDSFLALRDYAQQLNVPAIMISQVNGRGEVFGGRRYAHQVNAVIRFRQLKDSPVRELWVQKNRSGRAQFSVTMEMTAKGLV